MQTEIEKLDSRFLTSFLKRTAIVAATVTIAAPFVAAPVVVKQIEADNTTVVRTNADLHLVNAQIINNEGTLRTQIASLNSLKEEIAARRDALDEAVNQANIARKMIGFDRGDQEALKVYTRMVSRIEARISDIQSGKVHQANVSSTEFQEANAAPAPAR